MSLKSFIIPAVMAVSVYSYAQDPETEAITNSMHNILPDVDITRMQESQIPGLYTVVIGAEIFYVTADGQYLIRGDLIDLFNRNNLTEAERSVERVAMLRDIPKGDYIEFSPPNPSHTIYVFTDITCAFCQRFQHDVDEINDKGIAIRFLAFPRNGLGTETARQMASIWCAKDRQTALTDAMIGLGVKDMECQNPVHENFALGQAIGVRGTPGIFTEDGRALPGYMPPDDLLRTVSQQ